MVNEILLDTILIGGVLATIGVLLWRTRKNVSGAEQNKVQQLLKEQEFRLEKTRQELNDLLFKQNEIMQRQMSENSKTMRDQFSISQRSINQTQKETANIIENVTKKLTSLEKTNEQVVDFAKQLQSLEKILKNPKQRGVLGEYFLETTLKNVLPPEHYQMQYKFENGEIVDAAVFVNDKVIPIDSKFSLENYNRIAEEDDPVVREGLEKEFRNDLKKRIDETSKYIRPNEGTMEFAFMFIPSEGIYYDLLINKVGALKVNTRDLVQYAFQEKGVIIVSPTSFLAYLQTVLQGLRALKIEESAKEIKENVGKLGKHLKAYQEYHEKMGRGLKTTVGAFNDSSKEFKKIDKDVTKISGDELAIEMEEVDGPN